MAERLDFDSTQALATNFELPESPDHRLTEEELFEALSDRIAYMIEYELDMLLSLLYRFDVDEGKINAALSPGSAEAANKGLTRLVMERQKDRVATKNKYKQSHTEDWIWDF